MRVDKNQQVEEARRILGMSAKDQSRELARLAAQTGLSQAEILVVLRRQAGETPAPPKRSGGH